MTIHFITDLTEQLNTTPVTLALGNFDGVHLGHQALIARTTEGALCPAVFTFTDKQKDVITPLNEKADLLETMGIEKLFVAPFSLFKSLSPEEFVLYLSEKLAAKALVCGYNFRFGKDAVGNAESLKALTVPLDISLTVENEVRLQGETISSSVIRALLQEGALAKATAMLGRPYSLSGSVVKGFGIGKTLSFATLNLEMNACRAPLCHGVYITEALIDHKLYPAITNIGKNPTFSREAISCETHLLNASGDFYHKEIHVRFLSYLRPEKRFTSPTALKDQVLADIEAAKAYHAKIKR